MKRDMTPEEVGNFLARNPVQHMLISTYDGIEYEFRDDGGKVSVITDPRTRVTGAVMNPNGRRQQMLHACAKRRSDKPKGGKEFHGWPAFVSATKIPPKFPNDPLTTDGGVIALLTPEIQKVIARSVEVRADRGQAAREEGVAEAKLINEARAKAGADGAASKKGASDGDKKS